MKTHGKTWISIALTLFFLSINTANANLVTVDFNSTGGLFNGDYTENGFVFSPNCHYDFSTIGSGYGGSTYIGIDRSGCGGSGLYNSSFAGPAAYQLDPSTPTHSVPAVLYIDYGGNPFSLLDFWSPSGNGTWSMESSNGGMINASSVGTVTLSGADWTNISWLLFYDVVNVGAPVAGLDHMNFDVNVPEPATLLLILIGFAALLMSRKPAQRALVSDIRIN